MVVVENTPNSDGYGDLKGPEGSLQGALDKFRARQQSLALKPQNRDLAGKVMSELGVDAVTARVLAANDSEPNSELRFIFDPVLKTLPKAAELKNCTEAAEVIAKGLKEEKQPFICVSDDVSSVMTGALLYTALNEMGHIAELGFVQDSNIADLLPEQGAENGRLVIFAGIDTDAFQEKHVLCEDNNSVVVIDQLPFQLDPKEVCLVNPHQEGCHFKQYDFNSPTLALYVISEAKKILLGKSYNSDRDGLKHLVDYVALASVVPEGAAKDPRKILQWYGSKNLFNAARPGMMELVPRLGIFSKVTPRDLQDKVQLFLSKAVYKGETELLFRLLTVRDPKDAVIFARRLMRQVEGREQAQAPPIQFTRCDPDVVADTEVELSEINLAVERHLNLLECFDPQRFSSQLLIRNLSVQELNVENGVRSAVLDDGKHCIRGFLHPELDGQIEVGQRIDIGGKLVLSSFPRKEVQIIIEQVALVKEATEPIIKVPATVSSGPQYAYQHIASDDGILNVSRELAKRKRLVVDTEYLVDPENPDLCLIGVADEARDEFFIIDPIKEKTPEGDILYRQLAPLSEFLENHETILDLFSPAGDRQVFRRLGILLREVCDVRLQGQIARPDILRTGLADFAKWELGYEMDKTQQRSDWSVRPLHPLQVQYLLEDLKATGKLSKHHRHLFEVTDCSHFIRVYSMMEELAKLTKQRASFVELSTLEAHHRALIKRSQGLLREGYLPLVEELGITSPGYRALQVQPEVFEEKLRFICEESVGQSEMDAAIDSLFVPTVKYARAKNLLLHPEFAKLGFTDERKVNKFLNPLKERVKARDFIDITLSPSRLNGKVEESVNYSWDLSRCMHELNQLNTNILEIKRAGIDHGADMPPTSIPKLDLKIRQLRARITKVVRGAHAETKVRVYDGKSGWVKRIPYYEIRAEEFEKAFRERAQGILAPELTERTLMELREDHVAKAPIRRTLSDPVFEDTGLDYVRAFNQMYNDSSDSKPSFWDPVVMPARC